jgi:catechol 2,3-dioxygenase-like lactoylglutathione lyase family enzyme
MRIQYAMVFVSDMKRSVAFYRDSLGLALRFETPEWTEFATDGATLALHATAAPASGETPHPIPAGTCRVGFRVPDLDVFHRKALAAGVRCTQEPKDVFGSRIAQYADPDGTVFSVGEERPSAGR